MTPSLAVLSTSLHRCPALVASLVVGACLLRSTSTLLSHNVRHWQQHGANSPYDLPKRAKDVWLVGVMEQHVLHDDTRYARMQGH